MNESPTFGLLPEVPLLFREPVFALGLFLLLAALGRRCLALFRIPEALSRVERAYLYLALGAGSVQVFCLALSVPRLLTTFNLRAVVAILALLLLRDMTHLLRRGASALREARGWLGSRGWVVWAAAFAVFVGLLFVRNLLLGSIVEDDGYHLTAPKRWLSAGALDYLPTYTHTNAPMGFEMLYMVAMVIGGAVLAKTVHLCAGVLALLGVVLLARRLGHASAGALVVSVLLIENPLFDLPMLQKIYVDLPACWLLMSALIVWSVWRETLEPRLLAVSALSAGFTASFKFTALLSAFALALIACRRLWLKGASLRTVASTFAGYGCVSALPVVPWLFRNWSVSGNPVFPMFSGLIPTRDFSPENAEVFGRFFKLYNWGFGLPLSEEQRVWVLFAVASGVLAALAVAVARASSEPKRELLIFCWVLCAGAFPVTGLYTRYLLAPFFVVLLLTGAALAERVSPIWVRSAAAFLMCIALLKWSSWARADLWHGFQVAIGRARERDDDPFTRVFRYVNENTPADARALMGAMCPSVGRTSGIAFWVDRTTYTTDGHLQGFIRFDDWQSFLRDIAKARIDFVILADSPKAWNAPVCSPNAFFPQGKSEYPFVRRLVDEHSHLVFRAGTLAVYRLSPSVAANANP